MKQTEQLPRRNGFKRTALALSVAATVPLGVAAYGEDIKELPTAKVTAQTQDSYKVDQSTSHKYTQPILDTAKTISVIPQSVMKDRNVDSLRDALRNVPGISMAAGEGGAPTGDSMTIRGFSARNDIMIDGVRDIAGYARDTYNIEAIEVAKGPGSAVYGRGATGGSINLQSKTAKLEDFTDVSVRLGSESDYRAQLDGNLRVGDTTAVRVNVLADDGEVAGRDQVENSKQAIALSFATGIDTDSRLSINADYQKQDNMPDYGLPWVSNYSTSDDRAIADNLAAYEGSAPPVDYSNFYGNVHRDFEEVDAKSITVKYEKDLNPTTTLRTQARVGSVERNSIVSAPRFTYETDNGVRIYGEDSEIDMGGEKTRDTKDSLAVVQFDLVGRYQTGDIVHDVVAGVELAREKFSRWNYVDLVADNLEDEVVDLYNPNSSLAFTGQYGRDGTKQEAEGDTTSLYVFDTLTLSPHWEVSVGLRWDRFETDYQYDYTDASLSLEATDEAVSWNLGVVYKPAENGSVYFGAGTSFSPSAEDLTASSRGNNAELDPEETTSYELGTKWEFYNGQLFASAAIFRTEKDKARTDDPFGDDTRDDTLGGKQRVDGLELSAAGQITDQLSVTAAYTYQDSEVLKAGGDDAVQEGSELARTPKHSYSLWGRYDLNDALAIGLGAQYMGERYNSTDPGGRETAEDYLIFDMMLSYQVTSQWSLQLNGSNLTDEEYEDQLGGGHFVPGEGRYVSLSTSYTF